MGHRDRAKYSKLETAELTKVLAFVEHNAGELETAELLIRSSAGTFTAEIRSTEEPPLTS